MKKRFSLKTNRKKKQKTFNAKNVIIRMYFVAGSEYTLGIKTQYT